MTQVFDPRKVRMTIFSIALLLRLTFGVFLLPEGDRDVLGDAGEYDRIAVNVMEGKGLVADFSSHRMPLYPLFLVFCYTLWGHHYGAVRTVQSVLGVLVCLMVYLIGKRLYGLMVGMVSLLITALYPPFIRYIYFGGPAFLLSENLFIPLLCGGILSLLLASENHRGNLGWICLGGLLLGLGELVRPVLFLFPFLVFLWIGISFKKGWRKQFIAVTLFSLFFFLPTIPWSIRNYKIHGIPVFTTTKGGVAFLAGNHRASRGTYIPWNRNPDFHPEDYQGLTEIERDRLYYQKGFDFLRSYPGRIPGLLLRKVLIQWSPFSEVEGGVSYNIGYGFILPLALLGGLFGIQERGWKKDSLFVGIFVYFTGIAMVTLGDPRFRYPTEPFLILLAAKGIVGLYQRIRIHLAATGILAMYLLLNGFLWLRPGVAYGWVQSMVP